MFGGEGEGSDGGMQELTTTVPAGTAAKRLSPMALMENHPEQAPQERFTLLEDATSCIAHVRVAFVCENV